MNDLTLLREAGPDAPPLSPAARSAARAALLAEIDGPAPRRSPVPSRRTTLGVALGAVTAAAAWAAAVVVTGADAPGPVSPGTGGMTLVAVEEITFPLSLDPVPTGMTPSFTGATGSDEAVAGYSFPDGTGFSIHLAPEEPDWAFEQYEAADVIGTGTTTVAGVETRYVVGSTDRICTIVGQCFEDLPFAQLVWERTPGEWVYLAGDGVHGDLATLVAVGESLVDRPQPINLQVGLAPAGWSVVDWHESSGAVGLASDEDPSQVIGVQCMPDPPPGPTLVDTTVEERIASVTPIDPVVSTTVGGRPAQVVHAHDHVDPENRFWLAAWEFADGTLCTVHAPEGFPQDDVLAIAEGVTYTP
ncbi:MAG: hypothetical protein DI571_04090 [Arsenicicoccus sp.]|nr:MAG: hypothetical protein DI571_04090 [Arsenicicoccus sp.]